MKLSLPDNEIVDRVARLKSYATTITPIFVEGFRQSSDEAVKSFGFTLKSQEPSETNVKSEMPEHVRQMFTDWDSDTRTPEERCSTKLLAYFLWGVGAYLNEQGILRRSSVKAVLKHLKPGLTSLDPENFESQFDYIRSNEGDKFTQAGLIASGLLLILGFSEQIHYLDDQQKLAAYLIPMLELFLGYVSYGTETMFRPMGGGSTQWDAIKEYEGEVQTQYVLDFEKLHSLHP